MDSSELEPLLVDYKASVEALGRSYPLSVSQERNDRFLRFFQDHQKELAAIDRKTLSRHARADAVLFGNLLEKSVSGHRWELARLTRIQPFLDRLIPAIRLLEAHRRLEPVDPKAAAAALAQVTKSLEDGEPIPEDAGDAFRSSQALEEVSSALRAWEQFYGGYDPLFSWWTQKPFAELKAAVERVEKRFKEKLDDAADLSVGPPCGRERLVEQIRQEMVAYSPEELLEIGRKEFAWCENEMRKAAAELGFGDDWKAAMEHVKDLHVAPGDQPQMVKGLAIEAIEYLRSNDLLTVPPLAAETWRMGMMSAEKQKINPFFLGGEQIIVSYPTGEMSHSDKLMSMRGNNPHFSRATVQHELIPGHHMQFYMLRRHKPYRSIFGTCFWIEGWTLYWELLLWDLGFPRGPEDRIGMLFWRMHRCARIEFSLSYHLGLMSAEACVDMLVDRVGHERANAEGEVRRSFRGDYPPLYQAAYMLGGLQMMAMRRDVIGSGKMTDKQFHDAVMHENQMPLAVLRSLLLGDEFEGEFDANWRFYNA